MKNPFILEIQNFSEILKYGNFAQRRPVARGNRRSRARRQILWQLAFRCRCLEKTDASPPSICAQPQLMGPLPLGIGFLPQGIGVAPRIVCLLPQIVGVLPRETGLFPQGIGVLPRIAGSLPYVAGFLPQSIGVVPQIM